MTNYGASPQARASLPIWALAALGAAILHAGAVGFAYLYLDRRESDDALGAPAMEIGLELVAPRLEPNDLPPGPVADEAAASQPDIEQKARPEESELPKARPTDTEDPDKVAATEAPRKPKEEEPKVPAIAARASTESAASEAAAPPALDTPPLSSSIAPVQGTGQTARRMRVAWQRQLVAHLDRHKHYPAGAAHGAAQVLVRFTLDRLGRLLMAEVVRGSGNAALDEAALAMMRRSDPLPPPPPLIADEGLTFTLPVIFRTNDNGH